MALIPPTILAVPLPWLTSLAGALFGDTSSTVRKLKFWKRTKLTGDFWRYFSLTILIGFAALNTGNNLLYLVVAMLLSLIVISGLMSEATLRKVHVRRVPPRHIYRGESTPIRLEVTNNKRLLTSYSFDVTEARPEEGGDGAEAVETHPAYLLKLPAAGTARKVTRYKFLKRGTLKLEALELKTRFPFGLFLKGKRDQSPAELLVYPRIIPIKGEVPVHGSGATWGEEASTRKGSGTQLYGLRDYTLSDDARHIHWRSTAKERRLLVKEFEDEKERTVMVRFNNCPSKDTGEGEDDESARIESNERFERLVDEAASMAAHFIKRNYAVGLRTVTVEIQPGRGSNQLHKVLRTLALTSPEGNPGSPSITVVGL